MANFTTHIGVGTVVSGALATLTLAADVVAPENLVAVTMAGVLGSVLPDIDLKDSRAGRTMFAGLGIFFSFAVLFNAAAKFSVAELWILWLGTLVLIRYGLFFVFHRISVHRGVWHSLVGAAFCAVVTAIVFSRLLGKPDGVAWLAAAFMFIGCVTHLILDEVYSVDVLDTRIKASFGTALKLVDRRYPMSSAAMVAATAVAIYFAPPTKMFVDGVSTHGLWSGLNRRLLPDDKWFAALRPQIAWGGAPSGALVTGSVPQPTPQSGSPADAPVVQPEKGHAAPPAAP